jgi:phosphate transport system substrate-binding protein
MKTRPWLMLMVVLCAGCDPVGPPTLEGALSIEGSTTVAPIIEALRPRLEATFPKLTVTVTANGSGPGITAVGNGSTDLGMSSRALKEADLDLAPNLIASTIARDGLAVIVHPSNTVGALTLEQLRAIFAGDVRNWKDVGGPDLAISVVTRTADSGTASFFKDSVMAGRTTVVGHQEFLQSSDLSATVAAEPGAVGYVGLAFVDEAVRTVSLNAYGLITMPTPASVRNKTYPLSRDLLIISNGEPVGLSLSFIELLISESGQQAVIDSHYVPVR